MSNFATRLYSLRTAGKLSQEELAISVGTTKSTISKYEHSQIEPTLSVAVKLANYFNVTLDYLAADNFKSPANSPQDYEEIITFAQNNSITPCQLMEALNLIIKLKQ